MNLTAEEEAIRIQVFWEELEKYCIEAVEEAFKWARGKLSFFPKPVEIIDHIHEQAHKKYLKKEEQEKIEWMPPTEEGKRLAKKLSDELFARWEKEEAEAERIRQENFEKRRTILKKQADFLLKGGSHVK